MLVAVEQTDGTGTDRIVMEAAADANGNFRFCPLPLGPFDIVAVAVGPNNLPYNATAVLNVPNGTSLGAIPLIAETGALRRQRSRASSPPRTRDLLRTSTSPSPRSSSSR